MAHPVVFQRADFDFLPRACSAGPFGCAALLMCGLVSANQVVWG